MNSHLSRRRFIEGSAALLGVSLAGCGTSTQTAATPQSNLNSDGSVSLTGLPEISNGTAIAFTFPDGEPGLIYATKNGKKGAISAKCTHAGCTVEWNMGNDPKVPLRCPCHESHFNLEGKVLSGPAKSPLKHYDVALNGGSAMLKPI